MREELSLLKKYALFIFCNLVFASWSYSSNTYYNELNFKEANLLASLKFIVQENDSTLIKEFKRIERLAFVEKKFVEGLSQSLSLYDKSKEIGNSELEFLTAFLIAEIYGNNNNHSKAIDFYKRAANVLVINTGDSGNEKEYLSNHRYAKTLLRIGGEYQNLSINDSAMVYYKKLDDLSSLNEDILRYKAISYGNLSGIYQRDTLYKKAEEFAIKSIDIQKKFSDKINLASAINNLANIYLLQENFKKSKDVYLEGIELIEKNNSTRAVKLKANLYYNLAWAMRNLKEYEAYDYQEKSYLIEDGQRDMEIKRMIETITAKYDINTVKQQEEIKLLEQKEKTWFVTLLSISILIALIGTVAYFKFRQKNMSLKISRNELIQQQKIEKLKSESQIRILNATIDGKESERKQIAETLHDSVSTLLSSANLHLQACRSQFNGSTPLEIEKSQKIITEASDKIRDLSHTLVSSVLLKFGLQYSLKDMADKYSNSQIEIKTEISDLRRYDQSFEIKTYNIIQEFINNILKHSKATKAELTLFEKDQKLILAISDNGQGFDKNLIPEKDGLGINQIDARIKMMQGKFNIESSKGNGTMIEVELPIREREAATLA